MAQPNTDPVPHAKQRNGSRFRVVVPVEAKWQESSGKSFKETGEAKEVNATGGLLDLKTSPGVGTDIALTNLLSSEVAQVRVLGVRRSDDGAVSGVAVKLLAPSETFWGVNFQLRKASAELTKIEQAIKSGSVDSRILREFRDSVDYVRKTAWAVQEWQERQLRKHDPQTLLPLITTERIRRATQLSNAIITDLASQDVTSETAGIEQFFQATKSLYECLSDLVKDPQP